MPASPATTLSIDGQVLNRTALDPVRAHLVAGQSPTLILDVAAVERVAPDGLAELIELLSRHPACAVRLQGLHGDLLQAAIETGLAELAELWIKALPAQATASSRWAIIREDAQVGAGALDIAGQTLLVRQLQWLRARGFEQVVVQLAPGPEAMTCGAFLLSGHPLVAGVRTVPAAEPLDADELAARAALPRDAWFLELTANMLPLALDVGLELTPDSPCSVRLKTIPELGASAIELRWRSADRVATDVRDSAAEGAEVKRLEQAHALSCRVLDGLHPSVQVHASPIGNTNVWLARGASVSSKARLVGPVLLGAHAIVLDEAEVGPNAVVGERAVVERRAQIRDACVAANTLIGEGVKLRHASADARGIVEFADERRISIVDALLVARHRERTTPLSSRLYALLLLLLLLVPWLLVAALASALGRSAARTIMRRDERAFHVGALGIAPLDLVPALLDTLLGLRDLIGVATPQMLEVVARRRDLLAELRPGAIDLGGVLAPSGERETLLRMWHWYARHKTNALDRQLLKATFTAKSGA